MLHCINSSIVFYITWFSFEKRKSCVEINNSVQTYSYVFSIRCGENPRSPFGRKTHSKAAAIFVRCCKWCLLWFLLCVFMCLEASGLYLNLRSISVCEIKKKLSILHGNRFHWIHLNLSIYHIIDNRKLVTTLYTQDNRKNITEMTYVICMHGDY